MWGNFAHEEKGGTLIISSRTSGGVIVIVERKEPNLENNVKLEIGLNTQMREKNAMGNHSQRVQTLYRPEAYFIDKLTNVLLRFCEGDPRPIMGGGTIGACLHLISETGKSGPHVKEVGGKLCPRYKLGQIPFVKMRGWG